jgi:hypothetical protein
MEYKGKLYGKVGKSYFPLVLTTEDIDTMELELKALREEVNKNCNAPAVSVVHQPVRKTAVCRCCGKPFINPETIYGFCDSECMEVFRQTER